ncbi:hypothetical protein D9M71_575510 [compost metagenome]
MTKSRRKALSEKDIRELEAQIPPMASLATKLAYERAKSSGKTVVLSKDGLIVAEFADGTEQIVCTSKPRRKVKAGVVFKVGCGARATASAETSR